MSFIFLKNVYPELSLEMCISAKSAAIGLCYKKEGGAEWKVVLGGLSVKNGER